MLNFETIKLKTIDTNSTKDNLGNLQKTITEKEIKAQELQLSIKEHYTLTLEGKYKETIQFLIWKVDYDNQPTFEYNNKEYSITNVKKNHNDINKIILVGALL